MRVVTLALVGIVVYGPMHNTQHGDLIKPLTDHKVLVCEEDEISPEIMDAIADGLTQLFEGVPVGREGSWTVWIEPGTRNVRVVIGNEDQSEQVHSFQINPVMTLTDEGKIEWWRVNLGQIVVIPTHVQDRGAIEGEIHTGPFSYWQYSDQPINARLSHRIYDDLLNWCMRFGQPGQSETWEIYALLGTGELILRRDGSNQQGISFPGHVFSLEDGDLI